MVYALRTNIEVLKFIDRTPTKSIKEGQEFVKQIAKSVKDSTAIYWAIALKDSPKLIGSICFWNFSEDHKLAELGYELFPDYQGRGIMSEALKVILEYGFNTARIEIIEAFTHKDNLRSKSLLLKHDFKEVKDRVDNDNANNIIFIKKND
jgi:ribosomal-protein-alanine N-acetyltransferase